MGVDLHPGQPLGPGEALFEVAYGGGQHVVGVRRAEDFRAALDMRGAFYKTFVMNVLFASGW